MYQATKKPNEKLTGLDKQMVQVEEDFDEMMRIRNEEKKKLELKFKDVYQKYAWQLLKPCSQEDQRHQVVHSRRGKEGERVAEGIPRALRPADD
jgi:hypothetical protein